MARGIDERTAEIIYDEMKRFASYAFKQIARRRVRGRRLPHGVPQILLPEGVHGRAAHQRARLLGKVAAYMEECARIGIPVLPPHVNESDTGFSVSEDSIRFGCSRSRTSAAA